MCCGQVRVVSEEPLVVGALLPLKGLWSNVGQNAAAGLKVALQMEQFERFPGQQANMELSIVDTDGDPE